MLRDPVQRFKDGDEDAFYEIVSYWQSEVRNFLAYKGIPVADLNPIAQNVFLFIYNNIDKFQGGKFKSWIMTIANNKALEFFEKVKRDKRNKENALEFFLLQNLISHRENDSRVQFLNECLDELEINLKNLFQARYSGTSLKELSVQQGKSVSALKMIMMRTRKVLRACIEGKSS